MAEAAGIGHVVSRISEGKQGSRTYLRVDVWDDTTLRDDDVAQELVQPVHTEPRSDLQPQALNVGRRYALLVVTDR